jgi:hypothetical protein
MKLAQIIAFCVLVAAAPAFGKPAVHKTGHDAVAHSHKKKVVNPLRGSPLKLAHDNRMADKAHLPRLTEKKMRVEKKAGKLVPVRQTHAVHIDHRLAPEYRYLRPEATTFLLNFSGAYRTHFRQPLKLTSAVRSTERQEELKRVNGNAARGNTPNRRSLHTTGLAFDVSKKDMSKQQVAWCRSFLLKQMKVGRIDPTEEHAQPVFHIVVNPMWVDKPNPVRTKSKPVHHGPPHKAARFYALEDHSSFFICRGTVECLYL